MREARISDVAASGVPVKDDDIPERGRTGCLRTALAVVPSLLGHVPCIATPMPVPLHLDIV